MAEYRTDIHGNIWKKLVELESLAKQTHQQIEKINGPVRRAEGNFRKLGSSMQLTSGFFDRMIAYASIWQGIQLGKSIMERTSEFEGLATALNFASGSMEMGGINMEYVVKTTKDLGLALIPAIEGYTKLSAASRGTRLTQVDTRNLFEGISKAVSVLALNSERAHGTYMAFEQIMSKGKVSAEELRRQLGDRIPGAFQIAARAMGLTTTELDKMIRHGKLMSEDFLPKMARQLNEEFTPGVAKSSNTLRAHLNRLNTQLLQLKVGFGMAIIPELTKAIEKFGNLDQGLQRNIQWFKEHKSTIFAVAKGIVTMTASLIALGAVMKSIQIAQFLMGLGPVGLAIAGITVAISGAVTWYTLFASKVNSVTESHIKLKKAVEDTQRAVTAYEDLVQMKNKFSADDNLTNQEKMTLAFGAKDQIDMLQAQIRELQNNTNVAKSNSAMAQIEDVISGSSRPNTMRQWFEALMKTGGDITGKAAGLRFQANTTLFGRENLINEMNKIKQLFDLAQEIEGVAQEIAAKQAQIKLLEGIVPDGLKKLREDEAGVDTTGPKDKAMAEVLGGGNRIINITIHKQVENLNNYFDVKEGEDLGSFKQRVQDILGQVLLEAVNQANQLAR